MATSKKKKKASKEKKAARAKKTAVKKKAVIKKKAAPKRISRKPVAAPRPRVGPKPVPAEKLRWHCDPDMIRFTSTTESKPITEVAVQKTAIETLRYGLETKTTGHNIFIRGLHGTRRLAMIKLLCEELVHSGSRSQDRCYVYNFMRPDRPRLITLPPGRGPEFKHGIDRLAEFIHDELGPILSSDIMKSSREALSRRAKAGIAQLLEPFEEALRSSGLALVTYQSETSTQAGIFPIVDGRPVSPEEFKQLYSLGQISIERYDAYMEIAAGFEEQLEEINAKAAEIRRDYDQSVQDLIERTARWILKNSILEIEKEFPQESIRIFLSELVDDLVNNRIGHNGDGRDFTRLYGVNVVHHSAEGEGCPVVTESLATVRSLLGAIDSEFAPGGESYTNHMGIHAGSLLRADGGVLIIDVRDIFRESAVWRTLVRTLRTGTLEIVPSDSSSERSGSYLQPEAIPIDVKVVLLGDVDSYYVFGTKDPDFSHLFKVVIDFQPTIPRNEKGIRVYAQLLAHISRMEQLPAFDGSAVMALAEHGARIAGRGGKLTTDFDLLGDIACEAAYIAAREKRPQVTADEMRSAMQRTRDRADEPAHRFRELQAAGTIRVETEDAVVGQINGLAVKKAGLFTFGFPARITATIGPGTAGVINIEREAALSGAIHTKGFYILGGLLRYLLRTEHPLAFDASVAFEQSYGEIDGDSASGAEICCLLSALTGIPLRQDIAMTGAIDQLGNIMAVGAVNEKIEGFFDVCRERGLTGMQGAIIPSSNVDDLMLREDVVEAVEAGRFGVFAVETVQQALEILTGVRAGVRGRNGKYPKNTLLCTAVERARDFWLKASRIAPRR